MRAIIVFFETKTEADIKDYMYLNKVDYFSEAVNTLIAKGIRAVCKEGREQHTKEELIRKMDAGKPLVSNG